MHPYLQSVNPLTIAIAILVGVLVLVWFCWHSPNLTPSADASSKKRKRKKKNKNKATPPNQSDISQLDADKQTTTESNTNVESHELRRNVSGTSSFLGSKSENQNPSSDRDLSTSTSSQQRDGQSGLLLVKPATDEIEDYPAQHTEKHTTPSLNSTNRFELLDQLENSDAEDNNINTDNFDSVMLKKHPPLRSEKAFHELSRDQKFFVYLLCKNIKESTHVDFKTSVNESNDWKFRMLKTACSMYNGLHPDLREPSLTDKSCFSSYIVYGVKELDRKTGDKKHEFAPLSKYPGEEEIQDCFRNNTTPFVKCYFHLIRFDSELCLKNMGLTIPAGSYGMLEIPRGESGPAVFRDCRAKSTADASRKSKSEKQSKRLLYARSDAQNVQECNWDNDFRNLVYSQFESKCDVSQLYWAKEDIIQAKNAFRVLIITKFSAAKNARERETLAKSLGRGTWDVVLDFDRDSRKEGGIFTFMEEEMRKLGRLSTVKSWEDLSTLQTHDIEECQSGHRTIYVQVMGCSETGKAGPTNEHKLKKLLRTYLLNAIFEKNQRPRPVLCTSLCLCTSFLEIENLPMSPTDAECHLREAFLSESNNADAFKAYTMYVQQQVLSGLSDQLRKVYKNQSLQEHLILVPVNQLCHLFESIYPSMVALKQYELPGKHGQISLAREQFATFKPYLRLYHIQSGQSKYLSKALDQKEQYTNQVRRQFLAGNELTKEMLHLHDELRYQNSGIYVERRQVETQKEKVSKSLSHCGNRSFTNWDTNVRQIIRLPHEAVSGASTIAKIVLWRLRKEYPCIEVKCFDRMQEVSEGICTLHKKTELPVLVLFDSKEFPHSSVHAFASELNRRVSAPRFVAVCVEQVQSNKETNRKRCYFEIPVLTAKLSPDEANAFTKIYMESGGDENRKLTDKVEKETDRTPFLFGVWHFRKDYVKINVFIQSLLEDCENKKNSLLRFACLTKYFTHSSLNLSIAAKFLDLPPEQKDPLQVLEHLEEQRYLLTVKRMRKGWGLAPISIVGEKILEYLFEDISPIEREGEQVRMFVSSLCKMGEEGPDSLLSCLTYLVRRLISCQKRTKHPKLTDFFMTLHENLPLEEIERIFTRLANAFPETKSHTLVHFARYVAYHQKDHTKSIVFVRKALDITEDATFFSDTTCTDDVVLGLSAHLINCRVSSGPEISFQEAQAWAVESIRLCKKIQKRVPAKSTGDFVYKAHPFVYEIQAQRILLNRFFETECHSDSEIYFQEIENDCFCVAREAHQKIIENVLNLEKMHEEGEVDSETLTEKDMGKLNDAKEEFISRYRFSQSAINASSVKLRTDIKDNAYAWTIVDVYTQSKKASKDSALWDIYESDDNKLLARLMWDRVWRLKGVNAKDSESLLEILLQCKSKLSRTYLEACVLTILSRPTKDVLERGIQLAADWRTKFTTDVIANFIHGAFYLASALSRKPTDPKRKEHLQEAKQLMERCDRLTKRDDPCHQGSSKTFPGRNVPRLVLGTGDNLKALIYLPRRRSFEEQQKYILNETRYRTFTGYLNDTDRVVCEELDCWVLRVPENSLRKEEFRQRRKVSFAIALAYSGPVPFMI
ncbi:hypothetical protein BOX15_Mlig002174g2 [Macrostomum lignano]|uniref:Sterile alpha motif domain-containing protein 9-like n=1 Tax=Macrostomum lignano TaxID=282301 RepID=A0A267GZK0_9PLAT|nr:hypothetical protein BOX15_Mlig002174g2 [Macrostomum lignano]